MKKIFILLLSTFLIQYNLHSQTIHPHYRDGELYVKIKNHVVFDSKINERGDLLEFKSLDWLQPIINTYQINRVRKSFHFAPEIELQQTYRIYFNEITKAEELIQYLEKNEIVDYAEKVPYLTKSLTPNDMGTNNFTNGTWALFKINAQQAWDITTGSTSIRVAVVDDAVQVTHPDLSANMLAGRDVADGDNDPNPPNTNYSHGTHVAGIVSAASNNGIGVASIGFNIKIVPIKATNNVNSITDGYEGVTWARTNGCDVINMSWGGPGASTTGQNIINAAYNAGITLVAAAGNDGDQTVNYPAAYTNVISVANTQQSDARAATSTYGSTIDISAPGSNIRSTVPNNTYAIYSGTSMASPLVAGLCGLILSVNPNFTPTQVRNCLQTTVDPVTGANVALMGSGRINAYNAVLCAQASMVQYDASLNSIIAPNGSSCSLTNVPQLTIRNNGTATLTSCTISYNLNGGATQTYNWTGSLTSGSIATITLPSMTAVLGTNTFNAQITGNLNGNQTDGIVTNNFLSSTFSVLNPTSVNLPFVETFESNSFSTNGWTINNSDNSTTWAIATTAGTTPGNKSAYMDFYNYNSAGQRDELISPFLNFSGYDTVRLYFEHAYRRYPNTASDSLIISVSTNCGATYQRVAAYGESGTGTFATATSNTAGFTPAQASDWCITPNVGVPCFTIDLSAFKGNNNVLVKFEAYNAYSNNLYIDNINIWGTSSVVPGAPPVANFNLSNSSTCIGQSVTLTNLSTNAPTSYNWSIPGGTPSSSTQAAPSISFASAGTYTVSLTATNAFGSNTTTRNITVHPNPSVSSSITPNPYCIGSSVTFGASGANSYNWNINGSNYGGSNVTVVSLNSSTTTGTVTGTDANGCSATQNFTATGIAPASVIITSNNGTLEATSGFSSYQWYRNGTLISGATSASYTPSQEGTYHVVIIDNNGCSASSNSENIKPSTSVTEENSVDFTIYPNPTTDWATVKWKNINDDLEIKVMDITGKILSLYQINAKENSSLQVSLEQFAQGIYLVKIQSKSWNKTVRLIKK